MKVAGIGKMEECLVKIFDLVFFMIFIFFTFKGEELNCIGVVGKMEVFKLNITKN